MKTLFCVVSLLAIAVPGVAAAQSGSGLTTYRPSAKSALRAGLLVAGDTRAEDGFGVAIDYDVPITGDAGPGRLLVGPTIVAVFAEEDVRRSGCDVERRQQVIAVSGALRYVFDIHPRLRPWGRLGLGIYYSDFEQREEPSCIITFADDTDIGPGVVIGLGLDIDLSPSTLVTISADRHTGSEDFAALTIGFGWRF